MTTHLMEEAERLCDRVAIIDRGRIVDVDTPAALVARHCPARTVLLTTGDGGAEVRFRAIPRVQSVTKTDRRYAIRGLGDDFVTDVIQCLAEHRLHITSRPRCRRSKTCS